MTSNPYYHHYSQPLAFAPIAQDGWRVLEARMLDDGTIRYAESPLAGWMTTASTREYAATFKDDPDQPALTERERSIEPAIWHGGDNMLMTLSEYECSNTVVDVLGPGQDPDQLRERLGAELTAKVARHTRVAA